MNKGAKISNGKVILYVNSGDLLTKNALKIIRKKFNDHKDIGFIFGTVKRHYTTGVIYKHGINFKNFYIILTLLRAIQQVFFIKKNFLKKIGYFDTNFKISADYNLYFKLIEKKN